MTRPRLLDLFCGAGGCSVGYHRAGFDVTGVDNRPQPRYPYTFYRADALRTLDILTDPGNGPPFGDRHFDVIHTSPPCQRFSAYRRRGNSVGDNYPDLIDAVRQRLHTWGGPYVIENIPGAPLHNPVQLCGSSFGLDVRRHRLFETNVPILSPPCNHNAQPPRFPQATNRNNPRRTVEIGVWRIPIDTQREAMGIDWMSVTELSQAIPPAYTEYIGAQLLDHLKAGAA